MLALLHTSAVHVPVFDALRDAAHPGLELRHHVAAELLDVARRDGPAAVTGAVREAVLRAVGEGARAVLCTCSTIGQVAELSHARAHRRARRGRGPARRACRRGAVPPGRRRVGALRGR